MFKVLFKWLEYLICSTPLVQIQCLPLIYCEVFFSRYPQVVKLYISKQVLLCMTTADNNAAKAFLRTSAFLPILLA